MIPVIFAAGSAIASYFEKDAEAKRKEAEQRTALNTLEGLIIDKDQTTQRLHNVANEYNPAIMNDLNQTAVGNAVSGSLNPISYSRLIPEKARAVQNEQQAIDNRNVQVEEKISQLQLEDIPQAGIFDIISGGLQGYGIGAQIDSMKSESELRTARMKQILGPDSNDVLGNLSHPIPTLSNGININYDDPFVNPNKDVTSIFDLMKWNTTSTPTKRKQVF